jgi:exoribonuclease-2
MKDLRLPEAPEDAHSLLLRTEFWTTTFVNPHPVRFGVSLKSAGICPDKPPVEDRRDLTHLTTFAIDNSWSNDPDDAVSIETDKEGRDVLYVHIADPASSILPDSPVEKEACNRGTTLYLPENICRMLADEALVLFALGFSEKSHALTFKMILDENGGILQTEIFPSVIKVQRMTYEQANKEMESAKTADVEALCALYDLAQRNFERRTRQGAVNIELPEVHITVENGTVNIEPVRLLS